MTSRTTSSVLGLVGGLALGAWIGSEMTVMNTREVVRAEPSAVVAQGAEEAVPTPRPRAAKRLNRVQRATSAVVEAPAAKSAPKLVMTIPVSAPELHQRMKTVLARGTKLPLAVEGFASAEQFATVAHAARNTQVPFMLLKHRVVTERRSLEAAIRASKPDLDARMEANRARAAAKADIAALSS